MPLTNLLCGLIETSVNKLHQLDSTASTKRKQLNGTIIGVCLKEINFPIYFVISDQQIDVLNKFEGQADCYISVSFSALNQLQNNHQLMQLIKSDQLTVEGDIQLVQEFANLLTKMEIDWEEHLSHKVGDVIAHKFCYHIKKLKNGAKTQFKNIETQTALYLTEEIKLAPSALEVAYFGEQVSALNEQLERLEKRIKRQLSE